MSGEGLEGVDLVETEVDTAIGHGLVAKAYLVLNLQDDMPSFQPKMRPTWMLGVSHSSHFP